MPCSRKIEGLHRHYRHEWCQIRCGFESPPASQPLSILPIEVYFFKLDSIIHVHYYILFWQRVCFCFCFVFGCIKWRLLHFEAGSVFVFGTGVYGMHCWRFASGWCVLRRSVTLTKSGFGNTQECWIVNTLSWVNFIFGGIYICNFRLFLDQSYNMYMLINPIHFAWNILWQSDMLQSTIFYYYY